MEQAKHASGLEIASREETRIWCASTRAVTRHARGNRVPSGSPEYAREENLKKKNPLHSVQGVQTVG